MTDISQFGEREIREIAELIRHKRKNGLWSGDGIETKTRNAREGILVKNTESNVIPAYACMQVDGMAAETERNYIKVKKPTSSGISYLFNGHNEIEANGYGVAQSGPVFRAYKNSGTVTLNGRWAPTAGQYYLTVGGGQYVVYGEDDIATNVFRVTRDDVARLYRFTLNASLASGTAAADLLEMDGTDTGIDVTVRDPVGIFATLTAVDSAGLCLYQDGKYYVIQAKCP